MGFLIWRPFGVSSSKVDCRMVLYLMGDVSVGSVCGRGIRLGRFSWGFVVWEINLRVGISDQWLLAVAVSINQLFFLLEFAAGSCVGRCLM